MQNEQILELAVELEYLKKLLQAGLITDDEYSDLKEQLGLLYPSGMLYLFS